MIDFKTYLKKNNFDKYYKHLIKKLKNKTVIIYGTGSLFQYIKENYDLSCLNIIGVSDRKYSLDCEGKEEFGYKIIPFGKITDYSADYVIIATQNYISITEDFICNVFNKTKTKVKPLVKIPLITLIKEIWSR